MTTISSTNFARQSAHEARFRQREIHERLEPDADLIATAIGTLEMHQHLHINAGFNETTNVDARSHLTLNRIGSRKQ